MWFKTKRQRAQEELQQARQNRETAQAAYRDAVIRKDTRDQFYWHQRLQIATAYCLRMGA